MAPAPILAACDGSALGNPGPSGWGWYVNDDCWAAGGLPHSTNQAMELTAVLDFLKATAHLDPAAPVILILDSRYAIDCLTKWAANWKRNGWRNAKGEPVKNRTVIEPALQLLAGRTGTEFQWVKGHAGHPLNDKADEKCTRASAAFAAGSVPQAGPGWTLG